MGLMCTGCYEKKKYFDIEQAEKYHPYYVGTCDDCESMVVEVDDLCIDAIILLNKKGWTTKFCCSGHLDEGIIGTYVYFENMPHSIPIGFKKDIDKSVIRARNYNRNLSGWEGYLELIALNKEMYKWAISLLERKDLNA